MKYRIRMNGNGMFRVQRREWGLVRWIWRDWADSDGYWCYEADGSDFVTSEGACQALLRAQACDDRIRKANEWTTVVEDER